MGHYHLPPDEFAAMRDKDYATEKNRPFNVELTDLEFGTVEKLAQNWGMTPDQFVQVFLADITDHFRSSGGDESMLARAWYQRHGAYGDPEQFD